jgi:hypothetical protein
MKTQFSSRQTTQALPILAAMQITLIFSPAAGMAQGSRLASGSGGALDVNGSAVSDIVGQLGHNGLMILLGAVVLMGLIWICYISKACADLGKQPKSNYRSSVFLLLPVIGLCASLESCSPAQLARAAQYKNAADAENRYCVCPARHQGLNQGYNIAGNFSLPVGYSGSFSQPFCKHCGQRIFERNH